VDAFPPIVAAVAAQFWKPVQSTAAVRFAHVFDAIGIDKLSMFAMIF